MVDWKRVGKLIRTLRKDRDWSQSVVAERTGVSVQAVSNWEKGVDLNHKRAFQLASIFDVDIHMLLSGELSEHNENSTITETGEIGGRIVPRYNIELVKNRAITSMFVERVRSHFPCSEESFSLLVHDRANEPKYLPGDSLIIDPDIRPEPGDMVLAVVPSEDLPVIRQLNVLRSGVDPLYELRPLNAPWPTYTVGQDAIEGVVSEHTQPRRR